MVAVIFLQLFCLAGSASRLEMQHFWRDQCRIFSDLISDLISDLDFEVPSWHHPPKLLSTLHTPCRLFARCRPTGIASALTEFCSCVLPLCSLQNSLVRVTAHSHKVACHLQLWQQQSRTTPAPLCHPSPSPLAAAAAAAVHSRQKMAHSGRLPVQLLAYVLGKLEPQEVLQSCALVSSSWNKAAALCISEIVLPGCNQNKAGALRSWLQTHGAAAITSMTVCGAFLPGPELLLPVLQLTALQSLDLKYLRVGPAPAAGGGGADDAPVLDPALSAVLTRLQLDGCTVQLQGLPALTNLRHLGLNMLMDPAGDGAASNVAILAEAVPQLQQLTYVQLGLHEVQAATLAGSSCLTKLQRLHLKMHECTTGFLELLSSLTINDNWEVPPTPYDSISGLRAVTALVEAQLPSLGRHTRYQGGVATLAALTSLTKLTLNGCRLGTDGATLRVLTALTRLWCFELGRQVAHWVGTRGLGLS